MENKNVKEELENAIKAKDGAKIEEIIKAHPTLVKELPEGEYGAAVAMITDYIRMLDEFSAGFKTVGALPDDFFLNDALIAELKSAAEKRFTTQFEGRISKEEMEDNLAKINESIEGRANHVRAIKELNDAKREREAGMGFDIGMFR